MATRRHWWRTPFGNGPIAMALWWLVWTPLFYGACVYASVLLTWFLVRLVGWGIMQILTTPPT